MGGRGTIRKVLHLFKTISSKIFLLTIEKKIQLNTSYGAARCARDREVEVRALGKPWGWGDVRGGEPAI